MDYKIRALKGVGTLEFGMSPDEVRTRLGEEFTSFKRSPSSSYPCDYFPSIGVFAYYKASGELEALEFSSPAQPEFDGFNLVGMQFDIAKAFLQSKDDAVEVAVDEAIAYTLGISLYVPLAKENPSAPCESILVFEAGYYG